MIRALITGLFPALLTSFISIDVQAQKDLPADTISARLVGCWYAGDGGMRGYYCFSNSGSVMVRFSGKGREAVESVWSVDKNGLVSIASGKSKTKYLVERLAQDGFVLVTPKEGIRLEGHKEQPKGW